MSGKVDKIVGVKEFTRDPGAMWRALLAEFIGTEINLLWKVYFILYLWV